MKTPRFLPDFMPKITQQGQVIFQPDTAEYFRRGTALIVETLKPSLGPRPRIIASAAYGSHLAPEMLDDGGVISRRIIEIQNPYENMGAMFVRGMLWRLHEETGDGTATAAVLFQSIFEQGLKYIAAGGNAMILRRHLESARDVLLAALAKMVTPIHGADDLTAVARSLCFDDKLAEALGSILDQIGGFGVLDIQPGNSRELIREDHAGSFFPGGILAPQLLASTPRGTLNLNRAAVLLTDLEITDPQELVPVLRAAVGANLSALVIVANKISDPVLGLLAQSQRSGKLIITAAKTPFQSLDDQINALNDLASLAGGRIFLKTTGDKLDSIQPADFGHAASVILDKNYFGITVLQTADVRHVKKLKRSFDATDKNDLRENLRARIGRLQGGHSVLYVGGHTESEIKFRQDLAKNTLTSLRAALAGGVIPGGGSALLACRSTLRKKMSKSRDDDEKMAYRIIDRALEIPFRLIVSNAGQDADAAWSQWSEKGDGFVFDARDGKVKTIAQAGIYDIAAAQIAAVHSAVSSAALALTVDALVMPHKPKISTEPN